MVFHSRIHFRSSRHTDAWKTYIEEDARSKIVLWIAERTLSAKDFKEFLDEFAKKPKDNHDELLDFIRKEVK